MDTVDGLSLGANQNPAKPGALAAGVAMATTASGKLLLAAEVDNRSSSSSCSSMSLSLVICHLFDSFLR